MKSPEIFSMLFTTHLQINYPPFAILEKKKVDKNKVE